MVSVTEVSNGVEATASKGLYHDVIIFGSI